MTDLEIAQIFQELRGAGLANEPRDAAGAIKIWRDFFGGEDARVIGKAVWIHMRNSQFWPTPKDIVKLKQKAEWLVEMEKEEQKKLNALGGEPHNQQSMNQSTQPPRAPAINIAEKAQDFCQLCGLCEIRDQSLCPFDY